MVNIENLSIENDSSVTWKLNTLNTSISKTIENKNNYLIWSYELISKLKLQPDFNQKMIDFIDKKINHINLV